jgi:hypothetical protein
MEVRWLENEKQWNTARGKAEKQLNTELHMLMDDVGWALNLIYDNQQYLIGKEKSRTKSSVSCYGYNLKSIPLFEV